MTGNFVELPVTVDPLLALEEVVAEMQALNPGWEPNLASPEFLMFQSIVFRLWVPLAQLAAESGEEMFNQFGRQIVGVIPDVAEVATAKAKFTARDTAGYEIPAGTQINVERTGSEQIGFVVALTTFIAPGSKTAEVPIEAAEPGEGANGLSTSRAVTLIDSLGWVEKVELVTETGGGQEAEEPAHYLGRLAETMQTFVEGVVTAHQAEIVVRNVQGVGRAMAIDNYNAETKTSGQEKTITIVVANAAGLALSTAKKNEIKAVLAGKREANFVFFVVDPEYEEIDVTVKVVPRVGYSLAEADAATKLAIEAFLSPATWGQEPPGNAASWVNTTVLRLQDLGTVVNNVQQVEHYSELKFAKKAGTQEAKDLTLEGAAPLPKPGTIKAE